MIKKLCGKSEGVQRGHSVRREFGVCAVRLEPFGGCAVRFNRYRRFNPKSAHNWRQKSDNIFVAHLEVEN